MPDEIERKDVLNEVREIRKELATHIEDERQKELRIHEYRNAFDRHLEIYANNGKESARLATNVENLIKTVEKIEKVVVSGETRSDDQGIDVASIKADVDWLKRFFWVIMTATVGSIIAAIVNVVKAIQ